MGTGERWGSNLRWTGILSRGNRNILSRLMPMKLDINTGLMSHMGLGQTVLTQTFMQSKIVAIKEKLMKNLHLRW